MSTLEYTLRFNGDLHIGSGAGIPGILDERVLRDPQGFAYIPASTIKGLLRQSCVDLLGYRGQQERLMCQGQRRLLKDGVQQPKMGDYCQPGSTPCLICLLFGSPLIEGALWFSPAEYPQEYRNAVQDSPSPAVAAERDMASSAHAAIDRRTGRAREHQLFNLEVVQPVDHFTGSIHITRPLQSAAAAGQAALDEQACLGWLAASLLFIRAAGGRRRKGWGQCRFDLPPADNAAALQALRRLLGGEK